MRVLLRRDVQRLGSIGDLVEVADGYARNYLLPKKIAVPATAANKREIETLRRARQEREVAEMERTKSVADRLEGFLCYIPVRATERGHLFGSVTAEHIAETLAESGFEGVRASNVGLISHIEEIGDYDVEVMLHPEVRVNIKVRVAPEAEEEEEEE